jgi:hypothetical protein
MVALSAFTAHKSRVRNRELVTGQIIARNARLKGFAEPPSFPCRFPARIIMPHWCVLQQHGWSLQQWKVAMLRQFSKGQARR